MLSLAPPIFELFWFHCCTGEGSCGLSSIFICSLQCRPAHRKTWTLMYLSVQGLWRLQHMQQLWVVDLQQHPSDFTCQVWMQSVNQWVQSLPCVSQQRQWNEDKYTQAVSICIAEKKTKPAELSDDRPRSCFWSIGGAAASTEAVSSSGPWMCTGGSITGAATTWRHPDANRLNFFVLNIL